MPIISARGAISVGPYGFSTLSVAPFAFNSISSAVATGGESVLTLSSIPQTYKHLQIRGLSYDAGTTAYTTNYLRVNGVTSGYYVGAIQAYERGGGAVREVWASSNSSTLINGNGSDPRNGESVPYGFIIDIYNYSSTSMYKSMQIRTFQMLRNTGYYNVALIQSVYPSNNAITSITYSSGTNNFSVPTKLSLYGIV